MKNLKIGFIGCGKHARANIYPSVKLLNANIASVCARHLDRAEATASEFGAKAAYDDHKQMLKTEKLDAVFVITSGDQHPTIVEDCLRAGTHVFVEKPLGWNMNEAQRVADISDQTSKHVMVGYMNRFAPSYIKMKSILEDKEAFGQVLTLTGMYAIRNFASEEESFLRYAAIHYIDLIRFYLGEIEEIVGYKLNPGSDVNHVFSFASKERGVGNMYFGGVPSWGRHYEEVTVTGTKGYVKVENREKVIYHYLSTAPSEVPVWQTMNESTHVLTSVQTSSAGGWQGLYLFGYVGEVNHFLSSVANGTEPSPSAKDNVKTVELCDRLLSTLKNVT